MRRRLSLLALALAGCAELAPPAPAAQGLSLGDLPSGGRLWKAETAASTLRIVAFRGGALGARLGHHHLLQAERFEAALWLPETGLAGARGEIRVALEDLRLDEPAWRAAAGGEFNEKPVDAAAIEATRRNLLSAQGLDAARHPQVRIELLGLSGAAPWWVAELRLTLAGRSQDYRIALEVRPEAARLRLRGRLPLRHSDHGLQAFSVAGGLLTVQDAVVLDFDLLLS